MWNSSSCTDYNRDVILSLASNHLKYFGLLSTVLYLAYFYAKYQGCIFLHQGTKQNLQTENKENFYTYLKFRKVATHPFFHGKSNQRKRLVRRSIYQYMHTVLPFTVKTLYGDIKNDR